MTVATPPRRRQRARGALTALACMLVASGVIRVGTGAGPVLAQQITEAEPSGIPGEGGDTDVASEPKTCEPPADTGKVLEVLQERTARLDAKEDALNRREQELETAANTVDENLAALKAAEEDLTAKLNLADEAAEKDLGRLTAVYENMNAPEAAALFNEMAPEFAAGFLARMQPQAAASIMAGLPPKAAYTISAVLAGRNADLPIE